MSLENLGKKLAQLGQDTVNSAKKTAESVQLNGKISDEKKALEKLFAQIGEQMYEKAGDLVPEGMEEVFAAIKAAKASLAELEEQKKKIRGKATCPSCGKEVGKDEKFCSACGASLPESEEEETEEAQDGDNADVDTETLKADAVAAANEVGDIVNDAANKARSFFGEFAEKADAFVKGVASRVNDKKTGEDAVDAMEEAESEKAEDILEDVFEDEEPKAADEPAPEAPADENAPENSDATPDSEETPHAEA